MDEKILFVWQFIFGVFELKTQFKKKKKIVIQLTMMCLKEKKGEKKIYNFLPSSKGCQ